MKIDPEYDAIVVDENQCPACGRHMRQLHPSGFCQRCVNTLKDPETQKPDPKKAAHEELIERELCRRHLLPFVKRLVPGYKVGWFHQDLAARLERFSQRVENGESPRLIINVPPRHGKSELASKALIAWHLGRNPSHKIISATHSDRLAMDNSRDVLGYVKSPRFRNIFPDASLDKDNQGAMGWRTEQSGSYKPVGVGAGIAGYGADILVVDDPHRDKDAYSSTVRDNIHRWYKSSAVTRLMPGGGVVLIQTRWVLDDLTGRVLDEEGLITDNGSWEQVLYPAIAEKDEYRLPSGKIIHWAHPRAKHLRSKGEVLHAERYPKKMLEQYMKDPVTWQALYQQNPTAGDAAQFSIDQFDRCACRMADIPEKLSYYTTWDLALGTKEVHDYSVGLTGGVDADGMLWIVDIERERMAPETLVERIIDNYLYYRQQIVGIEKTQYAVGLRSSLEIRLSERRVFGFPHQDLEHGSKDKVTRAQPLRSRMGQGMVRIPADAPWYESFKKEMLEFPGGRHDDQVDSAAYLAQLLEDMTQPYQPSTPKERSWRDKLRRISGGKSWKTA